jgi:hypothetical protein
MFKQKNKKVSHVDTRITLDAKHNEIIRSFKEDHKNIKKYQAELSVVQKKLDKIKNNSESIPKPEDLGIQFHLENKRNELQEKIDNLEINQDETDYFIKTGNILYEYYNNIEDIADDNERPAQQAQAQPAAQQSQLLSFFGIKQPNETADNSGKIARTINDFVESNHKFDRASTLDNYLSIIDKSYGLKSKVAKKIDFCKKCHLNYNKDYEMIINHNEGFMSCVKCGNLEYVIIESDKPNYKDPPPEATYFAYKRTNHLNEILNQIQAKESTDIPDEILSLVKEEIRKERITDLTKLTNIKVRYFLRKLNLNKFYEHIAHIINKLNGLPPPIITKPVEDKLRYCFREIQGPWMEIAKKPKKNFLNYHYVLYKCVELLGHDEYKALFPLLKSREKILSHDITWKRICEKLNWEYLPTI